MLINAIQISRGELKSKSCKIENLNCLERLCHLLMLRMTRLFLRKRKVLGNRGKCASSDSSKIFFLNKLAEEHEKIWPRILFHITTLPKTLFVRYNKTKLQRNKRGGFTVQSKNDGKFMRTFFLLDSPNLCGAIVMILQILQKG